MVGVDLIRQRLDQMPLRLESLTDGDDLPLDLAYIFDMLVQPGVDLRAVLAGRPPLLFMLAVQGSCWALMCSMPFFSSPSMNRISF